MSSHVIRDRIWESRKLAECSRGAALAYPWIFLVADDWGRFEFNPRRIWSKVFGAREDITVDEVASWLAEYDGKELLVRYHVDGELAYWTGFQGRPPSQRRQSLYPEPSQVRRKRLVKRRATEGLGEAYPSPIDEDRKIYSQSEDRSEIEQSRSEEGSEERIPPNALAVIDPPPASPAVQVFNHWKLAMKHPNAKFTPERRRRVEARLREGYTVDELKAAIDGCLLSTFHQGGNTDGKVFDDLELICRDGKHVEQFLREHVPKKTLADDPEVQEFLRGARGEA